MASMPSLPGDAVTGQLAAANTITVFVLWLLQTYVFRADVPAPVQGVVILAVAGLVSYGSSFLIYYRKKVAGTLPAEPKPERP